MITNVQNEITTDIDNNENISVDFSKVEQIALQDIKRIYDIHRVVGLYGKKL